MPVEVARHEHAGAALVSGTLAPQPVDFPVLVHLQNDSGVRTEAGGQNPVLLPAVQPYLVVFEHGELDLLPLVLVLFGSGVGLLLPFLGAASEPQHQVQS